MPPRMPRSWPRDKPPAADPAEVRALTGWRRGEPVVAPVGASALRHRLCAWRTTWTRIGRQMLVAGPRSAFGTGIRPIRCGWRTNSTGNESGGRISTSFPSKSCAPRRSATARSSSTARSAGPFADGVCVEGPGSYHPQVTSPTVPPRFSLLDAARVLAHGRDLGAKLEALADHARALTGGGAAFLVYDSDTGQLANPDATASAPLPDTGDLADVARDRKPAWSASLPADVAALLPGCRRRVGRTRHPAGGR